MIDQLRALALFVKTVESGSFKGCADHYNIAPAIVSQQITRLEQTYGVSLLYRTTRKLSLTPEGRDLYEKSEHMVTSAQACLDLLSDQASHPSGALRLSMPAGLIKSPLMARLSEFAQNYPDLHLDIHFTDKRLDLIEDGIDLAIRVGQMQDSTLMSKKITTLTRKLVCTPAYLNDRTSPKHAKDLKDWDWIKMKMMPPYRILHDPAGHAHKISFKSRIEVDNVEAMCALTRHGLGLSTPPNYLIEEDLKSGQLIEVLPNWSPAAMEVYAVWPQNTVRRKLTSLLLDHL